MPQTHCSSVFIPAEQIAQARFEVVKMVTSWFYAAARHRLSVNCSEGSSEEAISTYLGVALTDLAD